MKTSTAAALFDTLLVANRGEIAVRIIRAAREAGLRTVAVYSDADRDAPHVRAADTAQRLGPAAASESYLSIPALLEAARRSGAQAVHPGYGFLSERAEFARACADSGLVFVGPSADVIDLLGRKDAAREIAVAAGVPVLPAATGSSTADAAKIGYPLLVKAVAGGGGKGMRIVNTPAELPGALAAARRESLAAFGDDAVLLERYVPIGRHIEVQVLADSQGSVLHLFERDCSVQRRHQKVVEEAPAPLLSGALRERLTSAAVRLARHVGYVNAGTVEFLVDGEDAYFLEMNTRLQVEHPVTELVTGLDLVALQLQVAQGLPLPIAQEDVTVTGSAIEVRVYAEDPDAGFLPQAGRADLVRWPARARVDAALESGQVVTPTYDPMLGKIIVSGATREGARRRLLDALDDTAIFGLTTNLGFLRRLVASDAFRDAAIDTAWLDRCPGAFPRQTPELALIAAGWSLALEAGDGGSRHPFGASGGWRLAGPPAPFVVELEDRGSPLVLQIDRSTAVAVRGADGRLFLDVAGVRSEAVTLVDGTAITVGLQGETYSFTPRDPSAVAVDPQSDGTLSAPMPGLVREVMVKLGDAVAAGEVLAVLEAMKMQLPLVAPFDGVVSEIATVVGGQVKLGERLFVVSPTEDES